MAAAEERAAGERPQGARVARLNPVGGPVQLGVAGGPGCRGEQVGGGPGDVGPLLALGCLEVGGGSLGGSRRVGVHLPGVGAGELVRAGGDPGPPGGPAGAELPKAELLV
jgi:hypothetical protein